MRIRQILLQLSKLTGVRFVAIALTFVQTIMLTRVFGLETFGLLSFGFSISALAILVLSAGLDQIMMRDIARFGPQGLVRSQRWWDLLSLLRRLIAPLTLAVSVIGVALFALTDIGGAYAIPLVGVSLMLPVVLIRKYAESVALGSKKVLRSILGSQIVYPAIMSVCAVTIWMTGRGTGAFNGTLIYVLATLCSMVFSLIIIWPVIAGLRKSVSKAEIDADSPGERVLLVSGGHFALISLGFVVGQHMDVLLTGLMAGPEQVSLVRVASRVAEMAGLMGAIALLQYKPLLAEAHGKGDKGLLQRHTTTLAVIFTATGLPITIGLWIFAEQALGIFGPEFSEGVWTLRIYLAGVFLMLICGPGNAVLSLCDQEKVASRILVITLSIQFVLDLILIPRYGSVGCAIANFCSLVFLALMSARFSWLRLNVAPSVFRALLNRLYLNRKS